MSYLNQVIRRTAPMTRCQCSVLAHMSECPQTADEVWKRRPTYLDGTRVREVAYGTITAVLASLVQQGFVGREGKTYYRLPEKT